MSLQERQEEADESGMSLFERNHYFNGKLMTARDMQAEQEYHRDRLHAISQHVLGAGLVCGLKTTVEESDERLYADIEPGLGLDSRGRPVVAEEGKQVLVRNAEAKKDDEPTVPEGEEIYLFLVYDECSLDLVPVPDTRDACDERCCYNRVLEGYEVVYTETEPHPYKQVPGVEFPAETDLEPSDGQAHPSDPALTEMARSYYRLDCEPNTVECDFDRDCSLFLGHFMKEKGNWEFQESTDQRPMVYTNDLLYSTIAHHVTNFDNPHAVSLGVGLPTDGVDARVGIEESDGLTGPVGLTSADDSITITPDHRRDTIDLALGGAFEEYYVYEQSLHNTVETYTELVEDARDVWVPNLVSHLAFRIARAAMHGIEDEVYKSPEQFLGFLTAPHTEFYPEEQIPFGRVEEAAERLIADDRFPRVEDEYYSIVDLQRLLRAALIPNDHADPAVPVRTYEDAVETLHLQAKEEEKSPFDIALAQHRVAEAAEGVLDSYPAVEDGFYPAFWAGLERYIHGTAGSADEPVEPTAMMTTHVVSGEAGALAEQQFQLGLHHRPVAQPTFGRGLVPEPAREAMLTRVVHRLIMSGWTYLLVSMDADGETPSNQVVGQVPNSETTAHKAPGILLEVHDLVPADEIEGIGPVFKNVLARYGIDTVSEVILAGPSVLKIATGESLETVVQWIEQALEIL